MGIVIGFIGCFIIGVAMVMAGINMFSREFFIIIVGLLIYGAAQHI